MLTIALISDKETAQKAAAELNTVCGIGAEFVFLDDGQIVGLWRMRVLTDAALTEKVVFKKTVSADDKNFFARAMLYKLQIGPQIKVRFMGIHEDLKPFGFTVVDGNTEIDSVDINLTSGCKG